MQLKTGLIALSVLINIVFDFYYDRSVSQTHLRYGEQSLSHSLLSISIKASQKENDDLSSIKVTSSDTESNVEMSDKVKKPKKKSKLRKGFQNIPNMIRRIFKRKKGKISSMASKKRGRRMGDLSQSEESVNPTEVQGSDDTVVVASVEPRPISNNDSDSEADSDNASQTGNNPTVSINRRPEVEAWRISKTLSDLNTASGRNQGNGNSHLNELRARLNSKEGGQGIHAMIMDNNPEGIEKLLEMPILSMYRFFERQISSETGGTSPIINPSEILDSTNIAQRFADLELANDLKHKAMKDLFIKEDKSFRQRKDSLFSLYNRRYGGECSISLLEDLVKVYFNTFMEFKLSEGQYQNLLDPRKSSSTERAKNISKAYYKMKSSKSQLKIILLKYVNCHMLIYFSLRIDQLTPGVRHEECGVEDLVNLLYYEGILLALKDLNFQSFKEREDQVVEYEQMLISGTESLSEEKNAHYIVLTSLSNKLFALYSNSVLFKAFMEASHRKASACLAYIVNSEKQASEISTRL
ncbi:hypothetical protein OJ253_1652 [Cryptosporidium canis]|uniref:Uncharacterized protein n=1 Tax=Cryptosporidium canis TaxID=195482 RepID=A0A9D5DH71_9CRYT|nr:hypothetical protein OJ253_1652 [Cryptosporidium canis]